MRARRFATAALAVIVAVGPACGSDDDDDAAAQDTTTATSAPASGDSVKDAAQTIQARDFAFEPKELQVIAGTATLTVQNVGAARHTFTIDTPRADTEVSPGEDADVIVNLPGAGEYVFYCRFHRASGMQGKLVVS